MICCSLSSHENHVIRAAAVEALANLYIAIERCYVNDMASMYIYSWIRISVSKYNLSLLVSQYRV